MVQAPIIQRHVGSDNTHDFHAGNDFNAQASVQAEMLFMKLSEPKAVHMGPSILELPPSIPGTFVPSGMLGANPPTGELNSGRPTPIAFRPGRKFEIDGQNRGLTTCLLLVEKIIDSRCSRPTSTKIGATSHKFPPYRLHAWDFDMGSVRPPIP
jgi:hypothetical protein